MGVKLEGFKEWEKKLRNAEKALGFVAANTVSEILDVGYKIAFDECPQGPTGFLRSSIYTEIIHDSSGNEIGILGVSAPYARYVNEGCFFNQNIRILTKRGYVNYKDLMVNYDEVYTHKQRWRKVTEKFSRFKESVKQVSITLESGDKIVVTGNHPIYNGSWIYAEDLRVGDEVYTVHNDLPHFHWKNFHERPWNYGISKKEKISKTCNNCLCLFDVTKSRLKHHKSDIWYCSSKCLYKGRKGKNHPNYGKKHPDINEGRDYTYMNGKNNPMFGSNYTVSCIGYRNDLGHMTRSTWEANYCRILKYIGLDYQYEPKSFLLSNGTTYTPDLKINDNTYIEIRGYMDKKGIERTKKFRNEYKNIRLIMIDESRYKTLQRNFSTKIPNWENGSASRKGNNLKMNLTKVVKIYHRTLYNKTVYNFSVEEDESYVSNHIVTHNTSKTKRRPFFSNAVIAMNIALYRVLEKNTKLALQGQLKEQKHAGQGTKGGLQQLRPRKHLYQTYSRSGAKRYVFAKGFRPGTVKFRGKIYRGRNYASRFESA